MPKANSKTKADIIKLIAKKCNITIISATLIIDAFFDEVKSEIANGGKINIPKFGIFESILRSSRTVRNPQTGETITINASKAPKFKASSEFKKHANKEETNI
ncbi:HU family DNA-binding protein [Spiroplasma endosymbiont of Virgichneumon dumeticola]|uniref:HU family DNA-binding protein n=1 Tax=Spiroplasma endosymbiont of Virgichneumon dumeticola TaxID=3139323 RepID=UPI0035C8E2F6